MKLSTRIILGTLLLVLAEQAWSETNSPEQIFQRCYMQITDKEVDPESQLYKDVVAKTLTGQGACIKVLRSAALDGNGDLITQNDASVAVLTKMNKLHNSWFNVRDYVDDLNGEMLRIKLSLFDPTGPALFYTKALFRKEAFKTVFTGNKNLVPTRSLGPSTGYVNVARSVFADTMDKNDYVQYGDLVSIRQKNSLVLDYKYNGVASSASVIRSYGGGILGSPAYLQENVVFPTYTPNYTANKPLDGGVKVLRRFGKNVMSDFLCRDLPAARVEDTADKRFVNKDSEVPFRNAAACTVCHATMDQMSGVIRGIGYKQIGDSSLRNNQGGITALSQLVPVSKPALTSYWPDSEDADYNRRPDDGRLFYRTSTGALVDLPVSGLEGLGKALVEQKDLYRCVVKRYYEFFVGVSVPWEYTEADLTKDPHQSKIVSLTNLFQENQNLMEVIEKIIASTQYIRR